MTKEDVNNTIRLELGDHTRTQILHDDDLHTLMKSYREGGLTSDEMLPFCSFEPELFVDIHTEQKKFEFKFCLDCDMVEVLKNDKSKGLSDFSPGRNFVRGLAKQYFNYTCPVPDHTVPDATDDPITIDDLLKEIE